MHIFQTFETHIITLLVVAGLYAPPEVPEEARVCSSRVRLQSGQRIHACERTEPVMSEESWQRSFGAA